MTEETRQQLALMRYGIIAPAICHTLPEVKTLNSFFEEAAEKAYSGPDGKVHHYSAKTLER